MKNDIQRFYDLVAEQIAIDWYPNDILLPTICDFLKLLPNKPRVLDFGCGPGHESNRFILQGAEVTGIDFSAENIRIANEKCTEGKFIKMDFRDVTSEIGTFDGVFACASLIHVKHDQLGEVIRRIASVLNNEGYFNAIVMEGCGTWEHYPVINGEKIHRTMHLYDKELFTKIVRNEGFSFVREGFLNESLLEQGWRNYIFIRN